MPEQTQLWVVVYQVSDVNRARQVRDLLRYSGSGVRSCVFEIAATEHHMRRLLDRLALHLDESDHVRVYRVCQRCQASTRIFGDGELAGRSVAVIV